MHHASQLTHLYSQRLQQNQQQQGYESPLHQKQHQQGESPQQPLQSAEVGGEAQLQLLSALSAAVQVAEAASQRKQSAGTN